MDDTMREIVSEQKMLRDLMVKVAATQETIVGQTSDHETRLRNLERIIGYGSGAAGVLYFIFENFVKGG